MSKIIKGDGSTDPTPTPRVRSVIPSAVAQADTEAERILADAARRSEAMTAQASADADRIRLEAADLGRREGEAAAAALYARAEAHRARMLAGAEADVARLAVQIAKKILGAELELGSAAVVRIVSTALQSARLGRSVVVRVSPGDLPGLEATRPELCAAAGRAEGIVLRADSSIGRGGCVVESELGTIDARLETQLDAIERALLDEDSPNG